MTADTTPAAAAYQAALQRTGRSQRDVLQAAGLAQKTVWNWLTGENVPYRENVKALADELNAPELLTLLPSRPKFLEMTCRECGAVEERPTGRVTAKGTGAGGSNRHFAIELDLANGRGVWTCTDCGHKALVAEMPWRQEYELRRKKYGKAAADEWLNTSHPTRTAQALEAWAKPASLEAQARGRSKAHDTRKGAEATSETRVKQAASRLQDSYAKNAEYLPSRRYAFDFCRLPECGQLLRYPNDAPPKFVLHHRCLNDLRSKDGAATPPARRRGRALSVAELRDTYEMTHRHLFGAESIAAVADRYTLQFETAKLRVRNFIDALPKDDRGGQELLSLGELFRWASSIEGRRRLADRPSAKGAG
jgi:transcriptional regulator with XRE-family HTH domain